MEANPSSTTQSIKLLQPEMYDVSGRFYNALFPLRAQTCRSLKGEAAAQRDCRPNGR